MDRIYTTDLIVKNMMQHSFYDSYKDLIEYRYLSLSVTTIEFIKELPWCVARQFGREMAKKINSLLPNALWDDLDNRAQQILLDPMRYIRRKMMSRCFNQVKTKSKCLLHFIRHKIVAFVKKILGMDPSKSIFAHVNGK